MVGSSGLDGFRGVCRLRDLGETILVVYSDISDSNLAPF